MTVPLRLSQNRQKIAIGVTIAAWLGRGYVLLDNFRHSWLTAWFYSYIFVHGFPGSRLFKMTFPEPRFVKLPNPVSRSKLQSRITLPSFSKIPNPRLQKSQIPDPEKPIGDPHYWQVGLSYMRTFCLILTQVSKESFDKQVMTVKLQYFWQGWTLLV